MRVMARTRQEIVKDEINAGAVQVLPAEGLFKVEKKEKKEWESPEHKAIREAKLKAWQEMQELTNPANQDFKAVRIQEMMSMSF